MIHSINALTSSDFVATKTDMSKAYDQVEWCFLDKLMRKMGFDEQWVPWVMFCVSTITYSFLINDNAHGFSPP